MKHRERSAPVRRWLAEPVSEEVDRAIRRMARLQDAMHVAVLPDVHLAGKVCNGVVLATDDLIYPDAVGGDIGCGMAAVAFDCHADTIDNPGAAESLLERLPQFVPTIRHHQPPACPWYERAAISAAQLQTLQARDGRFELGTLGRGNHFLEFQREECDGRLWLLVHSGSRCMGPAVRDLYLRIPDGISHGMPYLSAQSPAGRGYLQAAGWARAYAAVSRRMMVRAAAELMVDRFAVRADERTFIQQDHNHVLRQRHGRRWWWVHRKGAASARRGQWAPVPGSMGAPTYHVRGRGCEQSLDSCSHGAGRALSRGRAAAQITARSFGRQMQGVWFNKSKASGLLDEAPSAYRDIEAVIRAQRKLFSITRRLHPVLVHKG